MGRQTEQNESKPNKPKAKKKRKFKPGKWIMWILSLVGIGIICALAGYMLIMFNGEKLYKESAGKMEMSESSTFYGVDLNGKPVEVATRASGQNREIVESNDIPPLLKNAFIATEDKRFSEHSGVDFVSIGRALVKDIVNRQAVEGGSTITQQLAKNMFLNADKTVFRKATEVSIAIALENHNTKDEILTMYLNRIYFGQSVWGIKAAAKLYFGKSNLNDLNIAEMATLAGIPKAPSVYNPISNPDKSKERRATVLMLMNQQGYITDAQRKEAEAVDYVAPTRTDKKNYATFIDYVLSEAKDKYNMDEDTLLREGYNIYTTMNPDTQLILEQAYENDSLFQKGTEQDQKVQSSMVILDHKTGGLVAMIGGRDYVNKGLNRATMKRQPGSSFKPLVVYAPAIEGGHYNPYSMLKDEQRTYGDTYSPRNYDGQYRGQVSMFEAVRKSINAPAVWLLNEITVKRGMDFAKNLGIEFEDTDRNLAIALGGMTKGVTPIQMATAYGAIANNGALNTTHAIIRITDKDDKEVKTFKQDKPKQVMSAKTSWYTNLLLQGVVDSGTGTGAKMNRPVAGKTGTTQLDLKGLEKYNRDVWFVGFTPEWTAAVWEGYDKTDSKHYLTGSGGPDKIFKEVMSKALAKVPVKPFTKPSGVDELTEPPDKITDLKAEYVPEGRKVKLTWTSMGDNSLYQVYRKGPKDADFAQLVVVKTTEVNDITIAPGEKYDYYVTVELPDSDGQSDKSNVATVTVPLDASASPGTSGSPSPGTSGSPTPTPSGGKSPNPGGSQSPTPTPSPGNSMTPTPTPKSSAPVKSSNGIGNKKNQTNDNNP